MQFPYPATNPTNPTNPNNNINNNNAPTNAIIDPNANSNNILHSSVACEVKCIDTFAYYPCTIIDYNPLQQKLLIQYENQWKPNEFVPVADVRLAPVNNNNQANFNPAVGELVEAQARSSANEPYSWWLARIKSIKNNLYLLTYAHWETNPECFVENTKIKLYNAQSINVQDIRPGMQLIGDDNTPRTVLSIKNYSDQMVYKIMPTSNNWDSFTVNSNHILCLTINQDPSIQQINNSLWVIHINSIINNTLNRIVHSEYSNQLDATITLQQLKQNESALLWEPTVKQYIDYLHQNNINKTNMIANAKLYRPNNAVVFDSNAENNLLNCIKSTLHLSDNMPLDILSNTAWMVGFWLSNHSLFKFDNGNPIHNQLMNRMHEWAASVNAIFHVTPNSYTFIDNNDNTKSPLLKILQALNLSNPDNNSVNFTPFIQSSLSIRLSLLSGYVDGSSIDISNEAYCINSPNHHLAIGLREVALSCGLDAQIHKLVDNGCYAFVMKGPLSILNQYILSSPKQIQSICNNTNNIHESDFTIVEQAKTATVYGFQTDGNKRFLLNDYIVTHNSGEQTEEYSEIMGKDMLRVVNTSANFQPNIDINREQFRLPHPYSIWNNFSLDTIKRIRESSQASALTLNHNNQTLTIIGSIQAIQRASALLQIAFKHLLNEINKLQQQQMAFNATNNNINFPNNPNINNNNFMNNPQQINMNNPNNININNPNMNNMNGPPMIPPERAGYIEKFECNPNLIGLVIGKKGKNIKLAEEIIGVQNVKLDAEKGEIVIISDNQQQAAEARKLLEFVEISVSLPSNYLGRVVGKGFQLIREIEQMTGVSKIKLVDNDSNTNNNNGMVELSILGPIKTVNDARLCLEFHLSYLQQISELADAEQATTEHINHLKSQLHNIELKQKNKQQHANDVADGKTNPNSAYHYQNANNNKNGNEEKHKDKDNTTKTTPDNKTDNKTDNKLAAVHQPHRNVSNTPNKSHLVYKPKQNPPSITAPTTTNTVATNNKNDTPSVSVSIHANNSGSSNLTSPLPVEVQVSIN